MLSAYPALGLTGQLSAEDKAKAEAAKGASTGAEEEKKDGGCSVARGQAAPWALVAMGMVVALLTRRRR